MFIKLLIKVVYTQIVWQNVQTTQVKIENNSEEHYCDLSKNTFKVFDESSIPRKQIKHTNNKARDITNHGKENLCNQNPKYSREMQ